MTTSTDMHREAGTVPATSARPRSRAAFSPWLEGLRGIAAVLLVFTHVAVSNGEIAYGGREGGGLSGAILNRMEIGLPIFFVLSGVLLYRPFVAACLDDAPAPGVTRYFWRRFLRVVPAYIVLLAVALPLLNASTLDGPWDVVRPLLFLGVYEQNGLPWGMEQTWSLSTEVAFYLALPLVAGVLTRLGGTTTAPRDRVRRILAALAVVVLAGVALTVHAHRPAEQVAPVEYLWPLKWIGFLAVGMALATVSAAAARGIDPGRALTLPLRRPLLSVSAALVGFGLSIYLPLGGTPFGAANDSGDFRGMGEGVAHSLTMMVLATLVVAPLTAARPPSRVVRAALDNVVVRFLGRISYGIFLWHVVVIHLFQQPDVYGGNDFGGSLVVVLPAAVLLATVSYYVVERPLMRLKPWEWRP